MVRLAFATAALLLVLLHISYVPCEADGIKAIMPLPPGGSAGNPGAAQVQSTSAPPPPLAEGDTYRPPIINMNYFGGPVLWKPIRLYFVWYGTWTEAQKAVIRTASKSLTPKNKRISQYPNLSNYWSVVTKYYQEPQSPGERRKYASKDVSIGKEVDDNYSFGHSISGNDDPFLIIKSHIGQDLAMDLEQGVYFLFTSGDVQYTDSPNYCGYHSQECLDPANSDCTNLVNRIVFSHVPHSSGQFSDCNLGSLQGPLPNVQADSTGALDSMIVVYLHELLELSVDPYVGTATGWIFNQTENSETADLCSYTFVAGDWYYCDLPSVYPDFDGISDNARCLSVFDHHTALTEPKSHRTFNVYGIDGSKFLVQQFWSLANRGCVLQPEAACPTKTVVLRDRRGTIQRGLFFKGSAIQRYAPGQNCSWKISVRGAKNLNIYFDQVALGYDELDFVTVSRGNFLKKKVTGFGKNIKITVAGNEATVHFVTYGGRSPVPSAAGFIMRYEAAF